MSLPIKAKDLLVNLSTLTWGTDGTGKYYSTVPTGLSSGEQIAVSVKNGWNKMSNAVVIPYVNVLNVGIIGVMSTSDSFDANNQFTVRLLYI